VFGVAPVIGRFFTADEMKPGSGGPAAVDDQRDILEQPFRREPAGVGTNRSRLWKGPADRRRSSTGFPLPGKDQSPGAANHSGDRIAQRTERLGRRALKPGIPLEQAQTELTGIAGRLEQEYPQSYLRTSDARSQRHAALSPFRCTPPSQRSMPFKSTWSA
jgi:hypothetical protein